MKPEIPLKGGFEQDYLTGWRKWCSHRSGTIKYAQRKYWKRVRRYWKDKLSRVA